MDRLHDTYCRCYVCKRGSSLTTISRKIKLRPAEYIQTQNAELLNSSLTKVVDMNAREGFVVNLILMDQEFDKLKSKTVLVEINAATAWEQVGEIEQSIHTVKEGSRANSTILNYTVLQKQIAIHLLYQVVMFLNSMSAKTWISEKLSLREIILRRKLEWTKQCTCKFREYVEAHEEPDLTNTFQPHTYPSTPESTSD